MFTWKASGILNRTLFPPRYFKRSHGELYFLLSMRIWLSHSLRKARGEAQWFLALPPQLHTPAVRGPSASLESTYPAPVLNSELTHCPWGLSDHPAVATDFPSCISCTCSGSFPGRLAQGCYSATHLASYPALQSWNCFQSPSQGLQAKSNGSFVRSCWYDPSGDKSPQAKHVHPKEALCFWKGLIQISQTLGTSLTNATTSSLSFSLCLLDASFCLDRHLNSCFYLFMLLSPDPVLLIWKN